MLLLQAMMQDFDPEIAREFGGGVAAADFLGVPIFDAMSFWTTIVRFAFNLLVCWLIIHFFYYKKANRKDYSVMTLRRVLLGKRGRSWDWMS